MRTNELKRKFSIVTTCKGRLAHLKQSLPAMLAQDGAEVVVVDYCCPERAGDWVESAFPSVQVVRADGEEGFSNWRAISRLITCVSIGNQALVTSNPGSRSS